MAVRRGLVLAVLAALALAGRAAAQEGGAAAPEAVVAAGDSVVLRFLEADLRAVIHGMSRYLAKPVLASNIPMLRVSLETPRPVPRGDMVALLRGLVEQHGLEFAEDSVYYRIRPRPPEPVTPAAPRPGDLGSGGPVQLFVHRLKHARAADVAAIVNQLFGGGGEFSGRPGLSGGTLSDELRRSGAVSPQGAERPTAPSARPANLAGAVTIVPDELTNALLIRASEGDYRVLEDAIGQLDIRPLQVLVEVLIVEARHDRSFSLGADLFVPEQRLGSGTVSGRTRGGGLGDLVIELMNLGKAQIDATLRAAQSRGDVEIISRPVLLASNNTEARFLVGSQRPFVQVSRSLPTDSPSRDQVVQYRDVGTKLTVRPTINQDGYVSLIIQQEINAATSEVQFDAPVISTREASTQVLVRDGQTIVLGGLRDEQRDRSQSGVPILSGIPILGGLFGSASRRKSQTELYLFLTPRIIRTDEDADALTEERLGRVGP